MRTSSLFFGSVLLLAVAGTTQAQLLQARDGDWPWWRGPRSNGIAADQQIVVEWSATGNVIWKTPVPGRGHSSPTVVGERVILTTANDQDQTQAVVCFDRATGKQLWQREVNKGGFPKRINRNNTHASPTVASDGKRLFAAFLHHDAIHVVALDMQGNIVWQRRAGKYEPDEYRNGYAASPILYGSTVIVACDYDGEAFMSAFDRQSGEQVWKTSRPSRINYSSPVIAKVGGMEQLLISGGDIVAGYDPRNGKQRWQTKATTMATAGTMVWDGDFVFASGGYPMAETVCLNGAGQGKLVWRNNQKCYEQSMLAYDGHLYAMNDRGVVFCWEAASGEEKWRERLRGPISASPVLVGDKMIFCNEAGTAWVISASPKAFKLIATNQLGTRVFASPSVCGGRIYMRVADEVDGRQQETLYCIGKK